jgi:hypothetical protein
MAEMNIQNLKIAGPFTHQNLAVYLIHGPADIAAANFLVLDEAMDAGIFKVHETGTVGQLEAENLSDTCDVFVQAGEVLKGGRQDRTLGVDFVVPPRSGRVPVPTFCVESGRWHRRHGESDASFSSGKSSLAMKKLRLAAKLSRNQGAVWEGVAEAQANLSTAAAKSIHSPVSDSSYQLSMEDEDLGRLKDGYRKSLASAVEAHPDAIGYAFAINGQIDTADFYGSPELFRKLWGKLLDVAVIEAIAARRGNEVAATPAPENDAVREWLGKTESAEEAVRQEVPPRVVVTTRRGRRDVVFETRDTGLGGATLHVNCVMAD